MRITETVKYPRKSRAIGLSHDSNGVAYDNGTRPLCDALQVTTKQRVGQYTEIVTTDIPRREIVRETVGGGTYNSHKRPFYIVKVTEQHFRKTPVVTRERVVSLFDRDAAEIECRRFNRCIDARTLPYGTVVNYIVE